MALLFIFFLARLIRLCHYRRLQVCNSTELHVVPFLGEVHMARELEKKRGHVPGRAVQVLHVPATVSRYCCLALVTARDVRI